MRSAFLGLVLFGAVALSASEASAQSFTIRGGVDVRPLLGSGPSGFHSIADGGWLGIAAAPGLSLLDVLTLEVALVPMIPLFKGDDFDPGFQFMVVPGARVDLGVAYARGGVPVVIGKEVQPAIEAAVGISLLSFGYAGLMVDYYFDYELFALGAEVGVRF